MAARPIDTFRREIEQAFERGDATEHTHRPALKTLIESLGHGVTATNEPKRVECGAPDFVISSKSPHGPVTLGYIEAKDIGKPLDEVERSERLKRYLAALPNLVLTDYLEFRWYVSGERRHSARFARARKGGKLAPEKDGPQAVSDLLSGFLAQAAEPINDPKALALRMARLTHLIRDMIVTAFERNSASATLRDLHRAFEAALIPDLQVPQFADMFAQTLAYGLFAARCNHHGPRGAFKRLGAAAEIPKTNPFLRQLFETITGTARVFHADLWGLREDKYKCLYGMDIGTTHWAELTPHSPDYLFIPQENALRAEYDAGWKITSAMPVNLLGFQTHRDPVATAFNEKELRRKVGSFLGEIIREDEWQKYARACDYRPFDSREVYLGKSISDRPRLEITRHLFQRNMALNLVRQTRADQWRHALVSDKPTPAVFLEIKDGSSIFPLYLYPDLATPQAVLGVQPSQWPAGKAGRTPNLSPEFVADIEKRLGLKFTPDGRGTGVPPVETHGQDAHATIQIRQGAYLPHWTRDGATYAVCFRLADSLPESVIEAWRFEREDTIKTARQMNRPLTAQEEQRLDHLFSERVEKFLDESRGECWMRNNEVAVVVAGALKHFDGRRYQLLAWCVMPNHVHAVVRPLAGFELSQILHSWKSFSSKEANRVIVRNGPFWQPEYYDHLIRDENDFARQVEYVLANPLRAGLKDWNWVGCGTGVLPVETHGPEAHATKKVHGQDAHATAYVATFGPEDVFNYIYAIFHSPTYRSRYAEFLKSDFPRVPLTSDVNLFHSLCGLGGELVVLHLLESSMLEKPIARYPIKGPNLVDKGFPKYAAPGEAEPGTGKPLQEGRVYINKAAVAPSSSPATSDEAPAATIRPIL